VSTVSWQVENASTLFFTGSVIQGLLVVNHPNTYNPQNYQGTLLAFAMALIAYIANIWGASWWPKIQNGLVVAHIIGFLAVIIVLWVAGPNQSAKAVFTEFTNEGGWSTIGLSIMVGQISASWAFLGEFLPNAGTYGMLMLV
jgi:amino acid transporter